VLLGSAKDTNQFKGAINLFPDVRFLTITNLNENQQTF
jgi:hypothetical protein